MLSAWYIVSTMLCLVSTLPPPQNRRQHKDKIGFWGWCFSKLARDKSKQRCFRYTFQVGKEVTILNWVILNRDLLGVTWIRQVTVPVNPNRQLCVYNEHNNQRANISEWSNLIITQTLVCNLIYKLWEQGLLFFIDFFHYVFPNSKTWLHTGTNCTCHHKPPTIKAGGEGRPERALACVSGQKIPKLCGKLGL